MRNRSRITSQSDQSDDDQIFTPVVHTRSKFTSLHHTTGSSHRHDDHHEGDDSINIEGTRRSTRKRKLKYENYSDTWIVGSQALKGYPNMVNEEDSNVSRRITRNYRLKQEVDDEEDDDEADVNVDEQEEEEEDEEEDQEEENNDSIQSNNAKQEKKKGICFN